MHLTVRPYEDRDQQHAYRLLNQTFNSPIGEEMFALNEACSKTFPLFKRFLLCVDGEVVGLSQIFHSTGYTPENWLNVNVIVDRAHRGKGYGRLLSNAVQKIVQTQNPKGLLISIRDNDWESRAWAERRGYQMKAHQFESVVDLQSFPMEIIDGEVTKAWEQGIEFCTLEQVPFEENKERLYEVVKRLSGDTPDTQGALDLPYDTFVAITQQLDPKSVFLAISGENIAGLTVLVPQGDQLYTFFTGTVKAYRQKGIARVLKLLSFRYAYDKGIMQLRTNNRSTNAPMLAINQKLGYVSEPGNWIMERSL